MRIEIGKSCQVMQVLHMTRCMHAESVYSEHEFDDAVLIESYNDLLRMSNSTVLLAVMDDGEVIGMIGGTVMPYLYRKGAMAQELFFYVKPSWRMTKASMLLQTAFELWAKQRADYIYANVSASHDVHKVARFYMKCGYDMKGYMLEKRIEQ